MKFFNCTLLVLCPFVAAGWCPFALRAHQPKAQCQWLHLSETVAMPVYRPVQWSFSARQVKGNLYKVRLKAVIQSGWHVYSQKQPKGAIATAADIRFKKNAAVSFSGLLAEQGRRKKIALPKLGIEAYGYEKQVVFVQAVRLTGDSTKLRGTITYQACRNDLCLPPKTVPFVVELGRR